MLSLKCAVGKNAILTNGWSKLMEQKMMDYLFDLQGYLVLENTISVEDLSEMNQWIDDHWEYV